MQNIENVEQFGSHNVYSWSRDYLFQVLTTGKNPPLKSPNLIRAFREVDRADFLPQQLRDAAYSDLELEFAFGEKVNSPVLVAQMLQALDLKEGDNVLELGTGAGYTAVLIAKAIGPNGRIFTLERNQQIAAIARSNILKYQSVSNIETIFKDGSDGLISKAPFSAVHVSFAYEDVPHNLLAQLKVGGKLVTPLANLHIKLYERVSEEDVEEKSIAAMEFSKVKYGVE